MFLFQGLAVPQAKLQDGVILPKIQFQVIDSTKQSIVSMYTLSYCGYKGSECHFVCTFTTELSKFDIKSKTIRLLQSEVKIHD